VIVGRSTVMSNDFGLASDAGSILSYGNNHLTGNVTDAHCFPSAIRFRYCA
jgi:hypothetical protein